MQTYPLSKLVILYIISAIFHLACQAGARDDSLYGYFYEDLEGIPCVRLLNATGVIGCQALKSTTGILYWVNSQNSIRNFTENGPNSKFAIVMPYELMTDDNLRALESSGKLSGVIAIVNGTKGVAPQPKSFSPDSTCPNCEFGLYKDDNNRYIWNPNGTGLIYESYDFPIFALDVHDTSSNATYNTIMSGVTNNALVMYQKYPLKAVEFFSFMYAAIDAKTCLRRGWCSPIGGSSVYSTPSIDMSHEDGKPIVVVSAAMDSRSFFHDITIGVDNGVSGTIALLVVADALSRSPVNLTSFPKHILYTGFTGEAWGFSGSQRFVNDITSFTCKKPGSDNNGCNACTVPCFRDTNFTRINFDMIDSLFEFSQVAQNGTFYAHIDDLNNTNNLQLFQALRNLSTIPDGAPFIELAAIDSTNNNRLPPSSSMAFLAKNITIPTVVLGDFRTDLNNYYNSEYDSMYDPNVASAAICSIANVTAQAVWLQAQGKLSNLDSNTTIPISANCTLVEELLDCLVSNYSCPLIRSYINVTAAGQNIQQFSHYTSVEQFDPPSTYMSWFVFNFLGKLTSVSNRGNCSDCEDGEQCVAYQCSKTFTRYHDAYGMGLSLNDNGEFEVMDPTKPTWVQSTYDPIALRIFNVTSKKNQIFELVFGILITLITAVVAAFSRKYLKKTLKVA